MSGLAQSVPPLILALQNPNVYPHPVDTIRLIETHISWVILTGKFAYKIKKPVHFNFVDFSTLEKRQYYCQEELKLNQACAAPIYKSIVPLYGSATSPSFTSDGKPPFEYAVRMQEFPQTALLLPVLSRLDEAGQTLLTEKMALNLAEFHQQCPHATPSDHYGDPTRTVYQFIRDNITNIQKLSTRPDIQKANADVATWSEQQFTVLAPLLSDRKANGFIRQCHGDLHLGNMVSLDDIVYCFDRLEFNPELQWIDVLSDLAFLLMDLEFRGFKNLSHTLLNAYLDHSGDYEGLPLLNFYKVYRAMVRAKIALLETPINPQQTQAYLEYARQLIQQSRPQLVLTHGFSGSGKSRLSTHLAPALDCIILRSDVYRHHKRFHHAQTNANLYTPENIGAVYNSLLSVTEQLLKQGQSVWIDATFLNQVHRQKFISFAEKHRIPWAILDIQAPHALLTERLSKRPACKAGVSVLEAQMAAHNPLNPEESEHTVTVNTDIQTPTAYSALITRLQEALSQ